MAENKTARYGDFANGVSWDLNELCFRVRAARSLLVEAEKYDEDDPDLLGVDYLLSAIANRAEELALKMSNSESDYVAKGLCAMTATKDAAEVQDPPQVQQR